jgi:hypothetical protein
MFPLVLEPMPTRLLSTQKKLLETFSSITPLHATEEKDWKIECNSRQIL